MDAVKKKHWWQSPQLTWSVIGLLCLLVGYLVVLMYAQGGVPVRHHDADFKLGWPVYLSIAGLTPGAMFIRVSPGWGCLFCSR